MNQADHLKLRLQSLLTNLVLTCRVERVAVSGNLADRSLVQHDSQDSTLNNTILRNIVITQGCP